MTRLRVFLPLPLLVLGAAFAGSTPTQAGPQNQAQTAAKPALPNPSADVLEKKFAARLDETARRVDGVVSYCVIDLTSGKRFSLLEQNVQPTASTIKLAILYELAKQADEGRLSLDDVRPLSRKNAVDGGLLFNLGTPTMTLRDYATLMAIISDNTATNLLIDTVGMEAVNARLRSLGFVSTKLRRHMIDLAAALRGDENVSTAGELAKLLEVVYRGQGLTEKGREETLRILKIRNDLKGSWMTRAIPANVEIACKEGVLDGVRAEAAIIYAKNRPFIVTVMGTYLQDETAGEKVIEEIAREAYEYFSRLGAGSEYGRLIGRD
jgi:beta-lactamase class A